MIKGTILGDTKGDTRSLETIAHMSLRLLFPKLGSPPNEFRVQGFRV